MTRAEFIAARTANLRRDVERFRASFSDATPAPQIHDLRAVLRGLEESLEAAIEAAAVEWDRARRPARSRVLTDREAAIENWRTGFTRYGGSR